jgi:hypothetical protein
LSRMMCHLGQVDTASLRTGRRQWSNDPGRGLAPLGLIAIGRESRALPRALSIEPRPISLQPVIHRYPTR